LLFMIPADSPDHRKEFEILRNELERYNPELLDKRFVVAISKSDLLDDELIAAIRKELPPDIPNIFISSVTHKGIQALKDLLWSIMNEDENRTR
jgi:GTPase